MEYVIQLLNVYQFILLARVIMSWIPQLRGNPIGQFIYAITDPVIEPVRKILPSMGGLDFSVMAVWFGISYLTRYLQGMV